jgi:uncharacterized protein YdhG (YjbR/CyaY superfamily)
MSTTKTTPKLKSTATKGEKFSGFSADEKAAMKNRAAELKAEARAGKDKEAGEKAALAAIADLKEPDRTLAKRLHAIIKENAPSLWAKTWYGFPAYANPEGKIVCFFQTADKFKTRYATLGFNDAAQLDDGAMWPVGYALTKLTPAIETQIAALVKKAAG